MESRLLALAKRFWPELAEMPLERRSIGVGEVLTVLYAGPLALLGLALLARRTDLQLIRANLPLFVLLGGLIAIFNQVKYFLIARIRDTRFGSTEGSLEGVVLWSGLFILGPSTIWLSILGSFYELASAWPSAGSRASRWRVLRSTSLDLSSKTLAPLIGLSAYEALGGEYPLQGLGVEAVLLGLAALALHFILLTALLLGYLLYHAWAQRWVLGRPDTQPMIRFFFLGIALPHLAQPFGILAAGLFVENGLPVYLYFLAGTLLVAALARRLSWEAERSRQQAQVLRELEQLGNAIINNPPGEENLPQILEKHLPLMFPSGNLLIWSFPDVALYKDPSDWNLDLSPIWPWLARQTEAHGFLGEDTLPWSEFQGGHNPLVLAPILELESQQAIGGCYLDLHTLSQPWTRRSINLLIPALQSLATLIGSAMNQFRAYARTLELQRVSQELRLAGDIQYSFLPYEIPHIPGWQIAVALQPAGETSGDFFDIIPLSDGKVGVVIADVLDKGIGAALYMALSRTLLRTYALETSAQPEIVFFATNRRILSDTSSSLFVTAFFGLLDIETGRLTYSNAGHNPPYLVRSRQGMIVQELIRTGIPIGVQPDATWTQTTVTIQPGDFLVLYTDGVPEAQNRRGEFFTSKLFLEVVRESLGLSAEDIQTMILQRIRSFVEDAPPSDDITLMVLARDAAAPAAG